MEITTKYNLGDIVYPIWKSDIYSYIPCEACAGKDTVILLDGKSYICPNCNGHPKHTITGILWSLSSCSIKIESIDISIDLNPDPDESYIMYRSKESEFYLEVDCFLSEDLALVECKRRNGEQNAKSEIT